MASCGMGPSKLQRDRWMDVLAACLCLASFCWLLHCSMFPKALAIYPDELRYLHLGDSIFWQGQLRIRDIASSYSKILYPIALFPAMEFAGTGHFTAAVAAANSLLMSMTVPLSLWLARLCRLGRPCAAALLFLAVAMPDTLYAMGFMSENLYIPLGILAVIAAWKLLEADPRGAGEPLLAAGFGALSYLLYLAKEVGIVLLLSYAGALFYARLAHRSMPISLAKLCLPFCAFGLAFIAMKVSFFSGLGNVYASQLIPRFGNLADWIPYLLDVYRINMTWALLAFFFFPVALPLAYWDSLEPAIKTRYVFIAGTLLMTVAVVAYTISLNEDYPSLAPRQHLRYLSFLFLPFLALCFHAWENVRGTGTGRNGTPILILLSAFFLLSFACLEYPFHAGTSVDQLLLGYVGRFDPLAERAAIMAIFSALLLLFLRSRASAIALLCALMLAVSCVNGALGRDLFYHAYGIRQEQAADYAELSRRLRQKAGKALYLEAGLSPGFFAMGPASRLLDTCCANQVGILGARQLQALFRYSPEYVVDGMLDLRCLAASKAWSLGTIASMQQEYYPEYNGFPPEGAAVFWKEFCPDYAEAQYLLVDAGQEGHLAMARVRFLGRYADLLLYENLDPPILPWRPVP